MTLPPIPDDDFARFQAEQFQRQTDARIATIGQPPTRDDWMNPAPVAPVPTPTPPVALPDPTPAPVVAPVVQPAPVIDPTSDPVAWLGQQRDMLVAGLGNAATS